MVMVRITPISAGTICTAVRFSGLYTVRTSTRRRRRVAHRPPLARASSGSGECRRDAGDRGLAAVDEDLHHRRDRGSSRRRSKSAGITTPTLISPAFSALQLRDVREFGARNVHDTASPPGRR